MRLASPPCPVRRPAQWPARSALRGGLIGSALALGTACAFAQPVAIDEVQTFSTAVAPIGSNGTALTPLVLSQFDPSLGTLQGITFRVQLDSYDLSLTLDGYDDSSGGTFLSATLNGGQYSVSKSLPGGGGNLFASISGFGGTIFSEGDSINNSSSTPVTASQDVTSVLQNAGTFNDFIGTGNVAGLEWGYFFFSNSGSTVDLDLGGSLLQVEAGVGVSQMAGPATVSVDYTYLAAPVPEPATVAMMLAGLSLVAGLARRRSAAGAPHRHLA